MEDDGHRNPQGKPEKGEPARGTHMHNAHASCLVHNGLSIALHSVYTASTLPCMGISIVLKLPWSVCMCLCVPSVCMYGRYPFPNMLTKIEQACTTFFCQ